MFEVHRGVCHICGGRIDPVRARWEIDHVIPWAISRDDTNANLRPAHLACHRQKSAKDWRQIAKGSRLRAKHFGAAPRSRTPLPGGRDHRWKRKIDGTWVLRDPES